MQKEQTHNKNFLDNKIVFSIFFMVSLAITILFFNSMGEDVVYIYLIFWLFLTFLQNRKRINELERENVVLSSEIKSLKDSD